MPPACRREHVWEGNGFAAAYGQCACPVLYAGPSHAVEPRHHVATLLCTACGGLEAIRPRPQALSPSVSPLPCLRRPRPACALVLSGLWGTASGTSTPRAPCGRRATPAAARSGDSGCGVSGPVTQGEASGDGVCWQWFPFTGFIWEPDVSLCRAPVPVGGHSPGSLWGVLARSCWSRLARGGRLHQGPAGKQMLRRPGDGGHWGALDQKRPARR